MLRHARSMRSDPLGFLVGCAAEYGPVVQFPIPRQPVFFVNEPEAVLRVLQGNHPAYGKRTVQYRSLSLVTGDGLLVSDGEAWRRARRIVQPAFHVRTLDALGGHVADAVARLTASWDAQPDGALVDVDAAMMGATLEIVGQALFSTDLGPEAADLVHAVERALAVVIRRARSPLPVPGWLPTPGNVRLGGAVRTLDRSVAAMVARHRTDADPSRADLLSLLLGAGAGCADAGLTDRQVRDEVVTLIVAGHETVASALTWAWWLVAGDPAVGDRLAAEADTVLDGRPPAASDYAGLPYARQVLDEALRLYPPAWVLSRRALADDVLAGAVVPAGALVIASPYALHRNPAHWDRPDRFDPDRFAPAVRADTVRSGYLPFGAGPRLCVGRDFALLEGTLVLAGLAARYGFERVAGRDVVVDPGVTLRPKSGLPVRLRRR